MLRRCVGLIVTVALVVCVSIAPVGATEVESFYSVNFIHSQDASVTLKIPRVGNKVPVFTFKDNTGYYGDFSYFVLDSLSLDFNALDSYPSGSIGFYFSWVAGSSYPISRWDLYPGWSGVYSDSNTSSFTFPIEVSEFNFSPDEFQYISPGVQLSARIDDVDSLTSFSLSRTSTGGFRARYPLPDTHVAFDACFYVPSASLVVTESSASLDALESVADQIAEGNDIARAMYGDIMDALNALKEDTSLMASYINDCLTYLNSIETATIGTYNLCASYLHNLASIAQTAEDIEAELGSFHSDFMSKMELLIGTITSESDDIQATMDRIYEQLIAWLETNFKEAISPEFEGSNSDLNQGIANNDAIEQEWTGSLSDTWSAMHIEDFSFDSTFTSGFMWVSGWFSNIYNSLGLYGSIVILPLIIGICKLLLGYFRFAGHGHSKGGGDVGA